MSEFALAKTMTAAIGYDLVMTTHCRQRSEAELDCRGQYERRRLWPADRERIGALRAPGTVRLQTLRLARNRNDMAPWRGNSAPSKPTMCPQADGK